tara:strand:+ start:43291 stop:43944 length:654 start_codon:yes stop_codon:yes gene_type:complete
MNVRLVSYSRAHDNEDLSGIEDLVAYCARVSNPSNQDNKATNNKLIKYLIKHKHFSPFEMVNICVEIETTRDIGRQILRHRSFSFQEFSQRYADPTRDLSFEIREARMQDPKNRQNSVKTDDGLLQHAWADLQQKVIDTALEAYNFAVDNGIAKEQARVVLPEGNTMSRLYVNGTLRSWIHYIELREGVETQLEHREIAIAIAEAISQVYPLIKTGE